MVALVDFAGTKPGLLVESDVVSLVFLIFWAVFGCAFAGEAEKDMPRRSRDDDEVPTLTARR